MRTRLPSQTPVLQQKRADQIDRLQSSPSSGAAAGRPVSPLISRLLIKSQGQHPSELRPEANWKFRPCRGG